MLQKRNISIDILKCFAAILITNSHMGLLYHPYEKFATGGAIGDVLFFFCSGFTLFLGRSARFDNWYKRRINRIYPTVFAWAIVATLVFSYQKDIIDILLTGGGWFVSCIMIYYVIFFFIKQFLLDRLKWAFGGVSLIIIVWYLLLDRAPDYNMYGNTYFKWGHYFLFMLQGAMLGVSKKYMKFEFKIDSFKLMACIFAYYGFLMLGQKISFFKEMQILSLLPLLGITFYFYKVCNTVALKKIYENKYWGTVVKFIGGLCLEIYLVQSSLFTDKLNFIFPLNIIVIFVAILIVAYLVRCVSRVFSQTFKDQDYDWKSVFKLYL